MQPRLQAGLARRWSVRLCLQRRGLQLRQWRLQQPLYRRNAALQRRHPRAVHERPVGGRRELYERLQQQRLQLGRRERGVQSRLPGWLARRWGVRLCLQRLCLQLRQWRLRQQLHRRHEALQRRHPRAMHERPVGFAEDWTSGCSNKACNASSGGGLSCFETFASIRDAGCFDDLSPASTCTSPCLNRASTTGRSELNAVLSCWSSCDFDTSCNSHDCPEEAAACSFDVHGTRTCEQVYDCTQGCDEGNADCQFSCWETGSALAQSQLRYAVDCQGYLCEGPASATCADNCTSAFVAYFP